MPEMVQLSIYLFLRWWTGSTTSWVEAITSIRVFQIGYYLASLTFDTEQIYYSITKLI